MAIHLATYYHAGDVPTLPGKNVFYSTELAFGNRHRDILPCFWWLLTVNFQ